MSPSYDSNLLQLQALELQFQNQLKQYENAYANYVLLLNGASRNQKKFVSIPGHTYWGTNITARKQVGSRDQCQALCSTDPNCSGATFTSSTSMCSIASGLSILSSGQATDYAILPEMTLYILALRNENDALMGIYNQIVQTMQHIDPVATQNLYLTTQKKEDLINIYANLKTERKMIDDILKNLHSIEQEYQNNSIQVKQSNMQYVTWSIFALILVIIIAKLAFF